MSQRQSTIRDLHVKHSYLIRKCKGCGERKIFSKFTPVTSFCDDCRERSRGRITTWFWIAPKINPYQRRQDSDEPTINDLLNPEN